MENALRFKSKIKKNASLSSLDRKDYERLEKNLKKGLKVSILLIDEEKKMEKSNVKIYDIEEIDAGVKHKNLWGKCEVIIMNNIVELIQKKFMGNDLSNSSHDLAFAAVGAATLTSFNDGVVSRNNLAEFLEKSTGEIVLNKIKKIINASNTHIFQEEYTKYMSLFKYLVNLRKIIGDDAEHHYENYVNLQIIINTLISEGLMELCDIERRMGVLKGEYVISDAVKNSKNMYKFLLENSFEIPIVEKTNATHKSGAAIYWAERYDKYDFKS